MHCCSSLKLKSFNYSAFTSRRVHNPLFKRDSDNDKYKKCLSKLDSLI